MTELKKNRIIAAVVVNSLILIVIIAAVLIYQMVEIKILANKRDAINEQVTIYEQLIEQSEGDLEYYLSEEYLTDKAYEYGFRFPD